MFVRRLLCLWALLLSLFGTAPLVHASPTIYTSAQVESIVRAYFADVPAMAGVAKCESGYRQFAADGSPLTDPSSSWVGAFQISKIHTSEAAALGYDINTLEGNMMYARFLYNQSGGMAPWYSSESCWKSAASASAPTAATAAPTPPTALVPSKTAPVTPATNSLTLDLPLSLGMEKTSVVTIQQMLNRNGFAIAASGPGSPGQETTKFGSLTREAVRKFQCAKLSLCEGDEHTTGYGVVGPRTLAALQSSGPVALTH